MFIIISVVLPALQPLYAQDSSSPEPETPVLRLPDMGEEVTGLENREIDVPPPPLPPLPLPDDPPPMPEAEGLSIPESAYETETLVDTQARPELGENFSEAVIGAALWEGLSAHLSIFRPGRNPSYSLSFSHDSRDGFAYHDSGTGYSTRKTALRGRIRGEGSATAWSLAASFSDEADGLQGQSSDFYGIRHRYLDAGGTFSRPIGPLMLRTSLDVGSSTLSLERSSATQAEDTRSHELSVLPWFTLDWTRGRLKLGLESDFSFVGLLEYPGTISQDDRFEYHLGGHLFGEFEFSPALSFGAKAGFVSSRNIPALGPFSLWLSAGIRDSASLQFSAGLASEQLLLSSVWKMNPFTDVGPVPADDSRWFADLSADIFLVQDLTLRTKLNWALSAGGGGRMSPIIPEHSSTRRLYGYTSEEYHQLSSAVSLRKWFGPLFVSLGWLMDWIDEPVIGKRSRIEGELELREGKGRYGASLSALFGFDGSGAEVPRVDLSGFFRVSPGVRIIAELLDIPAAFMKEDGRVRWEPYLDTGFQAALKVQFSL